MDQPALKKTFVFDVAALNLGWPRHAKNCEAMSAGAPLCDCGGDRCGQRDQKRVEALEALILSQEWAGKSEDGVSYCLWCDADCGHVGHKATCPAFCAIGLVR